MMSISYSNSPVVRGIGESPGPSRPGVNKTLTSKKFVKVFVKSIIPEPTVGRVLNVSVLSPVVRKLAAVVQTGAGEEGDGEPNWQVSIALAEPADNIDPEPPTKAAAIKSLGMDDCIERLGLKPALCRIEENMVAKQ